MAKKIEQRAYFGFPTKWDFSYNAKYVSNFDNNFTQSIIESESSDIEFDFDLINGEGIFSNQVFKNIILDIQAQYKNTNNEDLLRDLVNVFRVFAFEAWKSLYMHNFLLRTANGDALNLWGNILGLSREFPAEASNKDYNYFNFDKKRFYQLIFYNPSKPEFAFLADDAFRKLLLLLLQRQFVENKINAINDFLNDSLAEYGGIRLEDSTDMSRSFTWFLESVPNFMRYYIFYKDVLPRPACVGFGIGNNRNRYFGFATPDIEYNVKYVGAFGGVNFINMAFI